MPDIPSVQIVARPAGLPARVRHLRYWFAKPVRIRRGQHLAVFGLYAALIAVLVATILVTATHR